MSVTCTHNWRNESGALAGTKTCTKCGLNVSNRARSADTDLYMRYLGVLAVLGDAAAFVTGSQDAQDLRESIEAAMNDATIHYPIRTREVLARWDVEPES